MNKLFSKIPALLLALVVGLMASASNAFAGATIVINNIDSPGVGFNDPTPAAPVGGNSGTTVGQQRLIAFQFAASIWGATITSGPTIVIRAKWAAQSCTATSGTLGSAGTTNIFRNFTNAPFADTWYGTALANALAGTDLNGATAEISATFNYNIGTPGCLESRHWYYGLDTNHGSNGLNLVSVLLHEFGHGLGFQSFTNEETGAQAAGNNGVSSPSIYDKFLFDNTAGKTWPQMTNAERVTSAINNQNLVWNGSNVIADAATILTNGKDSSGRPRVFAPNPLDDGSSISHWDSSHSPNQLMEPNLSSNLSHSVKAPQDLTFALMKDIGWCSTCPFTPPTPPPPPPANDNFASAIAIAGCTGSVNGTNVSATSEAGEPLHDPANAPSGVSVWYTWTAPSTGSVTIETFGNATDFDTLLAVYTGNSVGGLTLITRNDDIVNGDIRSSRVTFNATANTTYRIAVDGWDANTGNFVLSWTQSNCSSTPAPVVLTEEGTNRAVALDAVTQLRGSFPIVGINNFSIDQRTRVMLFTTNLGLNPGDSLAGLQVRVQGVSLTIERVGSLSGVNNSSYIIVKLDNSTPIGTNLPVVVTLNGVSSTNDARIDIRAN